MIQYYEIPNCFFTVDEQNQPVLLAPENWDEAELVRHSFVKLPGGAWCHYLNVQEYRYLMSVPQGQDVRFAPGMILPPAEGGFEPPKSPEELQKEKTTATVLCVISLVCLLLSAVLIVPLKSAGVSSLLFQAALVLMIIVRVKFRDSMFGKVLMWIFIVCCILFVIAVLVGVVMCGVVLRECGESCSKIPG